MDIGGAAAASNIMILLPRTSCGLILSLPPRTLQKISMSERKQSLQKNVVRASFGPDYESGNGGGRSIVDANMPFLRKRINHLRLQEAERENHNLRLQEAEREKEMYPMYWMDWEKEMHPMYHSRICQWVGLLHNYLIYTRPTVALATLSAMALVVTASISFVLFTSINNIHLAGLGA